MGRTFERTKQTSASELFSVGCCNFTVRRSREGEAPGARELLSTAYAWGLRARFTVGANGNSGEASA